MDLATEERTTRIQDPYSIHESDCFHRGHCSRVNLQIHQIDEHSELDNTLTLAIFCTISITCFSRLSESPKTSTRELLAKIGA